jgi:hypothetical protein
MDCLYCKAKFTTKGNLKFHQNNVRACLQIQDNLRLQTELAVQTQLVSTQKAEHEQIVSAQKAEYDQSISAQKAEYEEKLRAQEEKIQYYEQNEKKITQDFNDKIQNMLLNLAAKPTTVNNNSSKILLNMSPLNTDADSYKQHFVENIKDIRSMDTLVDTLRLKLTDENGNLQYVCTDPSRNVFKFRDKDNVLRKDPQASNLISIIQTPLSETIKTREADLFKILSDESYNHTHEQQSAENVFFATNVMKDLTEENTNKIFCNKLATKCTI